VAGVQLVGDVQQVTVGLDRAIFEHQLVQRSAPQRNDPIDGMAVVGDLDRFPADERFKTLLACFRSSRMPTRLLTVSTR
jgi:hypothetical protein